MDTLSQAQHEILQQIKRTGEVPIGEIDGRVSLGLVRKDLVGRRDNNFVLTERGEAILVTSTQEAK